MAQRADVSRDLLFGLLALRDRRIEPAGLLAAFDRWLDDPSRPLAAAIDGLGGPARARLEAVVAEALDRLEGHDAEGADVPATVAYSGSALVAGSVGERTSTGSDGSSAAGGRRYRILRPHARGGLGEVSVALDDELGREVALKEIRPPMALDPASQARFLREAEVTGRLEHPGIVPVYGLGRYDDGRPYYAMRLVAGETLGDAVEQFHAPADPAREPAERELAFRRLLGSVIDACNAVAYAHSRGVVHRDVKPENIMLGRFGETLVLDWGIAKTLGGQGAEPDAAPPPSWSGGESSMTMPGSLVGTPRYMSPEQAAGDHDRVGPASDVYGLGATLYCVLVGHAPFPDGDVGTVLERVRRGVFPAPRRLRRSIDPALEAICLKAMAREPGDRHASPLDLAREIEAWLADVRYRGEQARALNQARRSLARLGLERANGLFERGKHAEGMLWLTRTLEDVSPMDPTLERAVRASLAGWHAGPKSLERSLRHPGEVVAVAIGPDGRRLAACSGGSAHLWDVSTGAPLAPPMAHEGPVRAVAFRPDGRVVVTAGDDGTLRRWDALTGEPVAAPIALDAPAVALEFCPDGTRVATLCGSRGPRLWDAESGEPIPWPTWLGGSVLALAFHPDGDRVATACGDGRVGVWAISDGNLIGEPLRHEAAVLCLSFAPDGRALLAGGSDGKARLWDLSRGIALAEFDHRAEVDGARFRPGGGAVATLGRDGTARLWDAATGDPIGEPLSHRGGIAGLAFGPDGAAVATWGRDGDARLWDAATALPVGPPMGHRGEVTALAFSPDGRRLATGCTDGLARCWKVPPPLAGGAERVACWARVATGLEFDAGDAIRPIDPLASWELRRRLYELGGPPVK